MIYPDHVRRGQPQMKGLRGSFAWLNNNPGNLTAGGPSFGEYPGKVNSTEGLPSFMVFPTVEEGRRTIPRFLRNPHGAYIHRSLGEAMKKYCPPSGGDPIRYAREIVDAFKGEITLSTAISELTDEQIEKMARVIETVEGSIPGEELKPDDPSIPASVRRRIASV